MTFVSSHHGCGTPWGVTEMGGGHPGESIFGHLDLLNLNCLEANCLIV